MDKDVGIYNWNIAIRLNMQFVVIMDAARDHHAKAKFEWKKMCTGCHTCAECK